MLLSAWGVIGCVESIRVLVMLLGIMEGERAVLNYDISRLSRV